MAAKTYSPDDLTAIHGQIFRKLAKAHRPDEFTLREWRIEVSPSGTHLVSPYTVLVKGAFEDREDWTPL